MRCLRVAIVGCVQNAVVNGNPESDANWHLRYSATDDLVRKPSSAVLQAVFLQIGHRTERAQDTSAVVGKGRGKIRTWGTAHYQTHRRYGRSISAIACAISVRTRSRRLRMQAYASETLRSAPSRSFQRSSTASIPTLSRSSVGGRCSCPRMAARRSIVDSTAPKLVACCIS